MTAKPGAIPLGVTSLNGTSVFQVQFNIIGDAADRDSVPEIRLRTTAENSQQTDLAVISSNSPGGISPFAGGASTAALYFKPSAGSPDFRLQFDMLNFAARGDSADAMVGLDGVSICNFTPLDISAAITEAEFTFDSSDEGWTTTSYVDLQAPNFTYNSANGSLDLKSVPSGDNTVFGYWGSFESGVQLHPVAGRLYFAEFTVESDQVNAALVPSFRVRINESGFRVAQYLQAASTGTSFNSPTIGNPKTYTVFFPPNVITDDAFLIYSFDILTKDSEGDSTVATLSLTNLLIRSIAIP